MLSTLLKRLPSWGAVLAMAACSASPQQSISREEAPPPPRVDSGNDRCGAQSVQDRVGREFSDALREAIAEESRAERMRVLRPGDMATMDHRPDRLNIHLDDDNVIVRIECG
ncbi:I78 family peptidase inhibitor [Litchfieldella rifensis]|uniref:I78 family peptidase inhibitor n=1 Tax=Litchfieldella rifensis TaxID=762643 RepID=A0ABV7LMR9_9GAMM